MINIYKKIMHITKEQLEEYIKIQKKDLGIELTDDKAMKEAQNLLLFVKTVLKASYEQKKQIQPDVKSKKM